MRRSAVSEPVQDQHDFWPAEREGYNDTLRVAYATVPASTAATRTQRGLSTRTESRIAGITMLAGLTWFIHSTISQGSPMSLGNLLLLPPSGPVGTAGIGILLWLHAKWRRSVRVQ